MEVLNREETSELPFVLLGRHTGLLGIWLLWE
jgi:hypothetical protein